MEEFGGLKGNFHGGVFFSEQSSSASYEHDLNRLTSGGGLEPVETGRQQRV